ncbi:hypothetical protein HYH02_003654 [Chlamydomonas schloesseri]|uniref:UDP-3-O-acyl-N-acetylglucosamine deacetylase n=1 Tax=Chlamydomonas schloesseri TaxID=2026947 RepID=A0A835WR34_9CHLO|nr:hypothetical protein HYH02_003654 [Chlamydomonas schloesseri]|eukprot:KAG2451879.1 hypothetical protein HYH02_003654 [Chlamydomonas schloesseri]
MPTEYQQTLWASFTITGVGLHSGEYAVVRVRPAFAGEGRYFVRVPEGTNAARGEETLSRMLQANAALVEEPEEEQDDVAVREYKRELIAAYQEFVDAQEDDGFNGTFAEYMTGKSYVALLQRLREQGPPRFSFSEAEAPQPRGEDEPYVLAAAANITEPNPFTTALAQGEVQVMGVEALLSALEACGVDNARIEIEGGIEVPVIDGSAGGWAQQIQLSGLTAAHARDDLPVPGGDWSEEAAAEGEQQEVLDEAEREERRQRVRKLVLRPQQVVAVQRGASFVTLYPEDTFRLTVGVDRHLEAPVIGKQWFSWCMFEDVHYMQSLADARSWVTSPQQAMAMRDAGWLLGGTEGAMLIGNGDTWYDHTLVRHERDEPARHQMQDLIGDLSLLARDGHAGLPLGHVVAYDADHELFAAFVQRLQEVTSDEDWVPIQDIAGPSVVTDYQELLSGLVDGDEGEAGEADEDGEDAQLADEGAEEDGDDAYDEYEYDEDEEYDEYEEEGEEAPEAGKARR